MRALLPIVVLATAVAVAPNAVAGAGFTYEPESGPLAVGAPRGSIYSQPPSLGLSVNASTAFDSEVADDLPDSLAGSSIGEVTLYVAQWAHGEWVEPLGLVVRFYNGTCPPPLDASIEYSFSWNQLKTALVDSSPPVRIIYSATASLPSPLAVTVGMSMGAHVVIDWDDQPYTGLTLTAPDVVCGCGVAYWDDAAHGAPRWTEMSDTPGIAVDLAYNLANAGTGVPEDRPSSWGRIKNLFR